MIYTQALGVYKRVEFLFWFAHGCTYTSSVLYLTETRGFTLTQAGTLWAFFNILSIFLQLPTGLCADRFGRKRVFVASVCISSAALLLHASFTAYPWFFLSIGLYALGRSAATGTTQAWLIEQAGVAGGREEVVADIATIEQRIFSYGMILGNLFGSAAVSLTGTFAGSYMLGGIAFFMAAVTGNHLLDEMRGATVCGESGAQQSFRGLARNAVGELRLKPELGFIIGIGFFLNLSIITVFAYWPVALNPMFAQLSADTMAAMTSLPGWLSWLSRFVSEKSFPGYFGMLTDIFWACGATAAHALFTRTKNAVPLIAAGFAMYAASLFILSRSTHHYALVVAMILAINVAISACVKLLRQTFNNAADNATRATLLSFYFMSAALGSATGNYAAGVMTERYSFSVTWMLAAMVFALGVGPLLWHLAKHERS